MNNGSRKPFFLLLALAVLVLDQWSKWWMDGHLDPRHPVAIVPDFLQLTHVRNPGVAFGMFAAEGLLATLALVAVGLAALGAIGLYFRRTPPREESLLLGLALVLGGACGNLLDRVFAGAVTDFVDLHIGGHHWPAFNVADGAISVAVVLVVIDAFRPRRGVSLPESTA
jgi:signal peptidase II